MLESRNSLGIALASCAVFLFTGCTHPMEITNREAFSVEPTKGFPIDVAIQQFNGSTDEGKYFQAIVSGLRAHPYIRIVRTDWKDGNIAGSFDSSHFLVIQINSKYRGSALNFVTTFPGFLLFAHSWSGYGYSAEITTNIDVYLTTAGESALRNDRYAARAPSETITNLFKFRYCDFERGFWSGTGWWVPTFGLHNIIVGLFHIKYDTDATAPFHLAADSVYGDYVAERIAVLLRNSGAEKYALIRRKANKR